jgi:type II secretory ATPase GspE/PulE/Tfp pilus assembly ATPase PilB-like protein
MAPRSNTSRFNRTWQDACGSEAIFTAMSEQIHTLRKAPTLPEVLRPAEKREEHHDSPPAVRIQKMIFEEAVALDASDVHIEPRASVTCVRYRVNGLMKDGVEVPRWMHENLVARIKILAKLDISERRVPQDGHISGDGDSPDIRVSVLPSKSGEKIVLRLLKNNRAAKSLPELNLPANVEETLRALIHRPQGIVLVVGPTGSGKTTTLYSMVHEVCREPLNIVTIEDPVEYELERITQVQVHDKAGLTFARALRAILRQDPDVILIGEIRDAETAKIAFEASMTGHLVLSTLHTTDCVSALSRLMELGVNRDTIATGMAAVIAQRLVRENCTACNEPDFPRPMYLKRLGISEDEHTQFRKGAGCPNCDFTGIRGRSGLYEVMEVNRPIRNALMEGTESDIRQALKQSGVKTLTEQAIGRVAEGSMAVAEAYRTCYFGGMDA